MGVPAEGKALNQGFLPEFAPFRRAPSGFTLNQWREFNHRSLPLIEDAFSEAELEVSLRQAPPRAGTRSTSSRSATSWRRTQHLRDG